jgi:hypothetical protein
MTISKETDEVDPSSLTIMDPRSVTKETQQKSASVVWSIIR